MSKLILIYSDGTGQRGGDKPDQTLSNIYKLFRATRPGPESTIDPQGQVAFYDPGLGKGEVRGWTFKRTQHLLAATIGFGIDRNIIDCYEQIIAFYEPGDRICVFGFSRGAYTVRALSSLMNLCGVPTQLADGSPVPRHGAILREIATEAVRDVYNHGAGKPRGQQPYFAQREELGRRFRLTYGSSQHGDPKAQRGNVEPCFIGVFDTVAALGSGYLIYILLGFIAALLILVAATFWLDLHWLAKLASITMSGASMRWLYKATRKTYSPVCKRLGIDCRDSTKIQLRKPSSHWAIWKNKNYDRFLSEEVVYARHAVSIDEERANFPRVEWGPKRTPTVRINQSPEWLQQIWFAGCHSDIGGSYAESESRLSDIALGWMVEEMRKCVPDIQVEPDKLRIFGDHKGLQHEERWMFKPLRLSWRKKPRYVYEEGTLHESVYERFAAGAVPVVDKVIPYRPEQLKGHHRLKAYYGQAETEPHRPD